MAKYGTLFSDIIPPVDLMFKLLWIRFLGSANNSQTYIIGWDVLPFVSDIPRKDLECQICWGYELGSTWARRVAFSLRWQEKTVCDPGPGKNSQQVASNQQPEGAGANWETVKRVLPSGAPHFAVDKK